MIILHPFRRLPTVQLTPDNVVEEDDLVAIETALEVRIGNEFLAAFLCSPGNEKELAIGYLLSTGIVQQASDIKHIEFSNNRCKVIMMNGASFNRQRAFSQIRRFIGTECSAPELLRDLRTAQGLPCIKNEIDVSFERMQKGIKLLNELQVNRRKTGAFHGALLHHIEANQYVIAEDLGRHNAVDKAIGMAIVQGIEPMSCFLISSGRLTADIVSKCAWTRIPLLASFAVSTDAGVKFAQKANITLIGSFKGHKMRLYNQGAASIVFEKAQQNN